MTRDEFLLRQANLIDLGLPHVVVTVVGAKGSIPQVLGAKALVDSKGLVIGTVGGGKVEAFAIKQATSLLEAGSTPCEIVRLNLNRDLGMTCGGQATLLFECYGSQAQWACAVFGAGHVAQALIPHLLQLGCNVHCYDSRSEWLAKLPPGPSRNLRTLLTGDLPGMLSSVPRRAQIVVMTQGHATDLPVLTRALRDYDFPYVGVIGSQSKAASLKKALLEAGVTHEKVESLHCPIGLPLGRSTPAEMAISIVAQLIWQRDHEAGTSESKWRKAAVLAPRAEEQTL